MESEAHLIGVAGGLAARLIVCERTGRWAVALRRGTGRRRRPGLGNPDLGRLPRNWSRAPLRSSFWKWAAICRACCVSSCGSREIFPRRGWPRRRLSMGPGARGRGSGVRSYKITAETQRRREKNNLRVSASLR